MAIQTEHYTIGETGYTYTYSDEGYLIEQESTGRIYAAAFDLDEYPQTYTETEEKREGWDDSKEIYAEVGRILLGEEQE